MSDSDWVEVSPDGSWAPVSEKDAPKLSGFQRAIQRLDLPGTFEFAGQLIGEFAGAPLAPETAGGSLVVGSGLGAGIGHGAGAVINNLAGVPTPYDYSGAFKRGVTGSLTGQALGAGVNKLAGVFPSAKAKAGELYQKAREFSADRFGVFTEGPKGKPEVWVPPPAVAQEFATATARTNALAQAREGLGVTALMPEGASPNIRVQRQVHRAAARDAANRRFDIVGSEKARGDMVREQAEKGLHAAVPTASVDKSALDFMQKELAKVRAAELAAREASEAAAKTAVAEGKTLAAAGTVGTDLRLPDPLAEQKTGRSLLERLRGNSAELAPGQTGRAAVKSAFDAEYAKIGEATAPSEKFLKVLEAAKKESAEAGQVLRNFVDEGTAAERRLRALVDTGPEVKTLAEEVEIPTEFTLSQWRGLKGEFEAAARVNEKAGNYAAAGQLRKLSTLARDGETAAAKALGPEGEEAYWTVSKAYNDVYVQPFRFGHGGDLVGRGAETGQFRLKAGGVLKTLEDVDNAADFMAALGAEKAVQTGQHLTVGRDQLVELGRQEAKSIAQPYFEAKLAEVYHKALGGEAGVKAVRRYLANPAQRKFVAAYGLDTSKVASKLSAYDEALARVSGAQSAVAAETVGEVLRVQDPLKISQYILKAPDPAAAYARVLKVSPAPQFRNGVRRLVLDELKGAIDKGADVFADPRLSRVAESVFPNPAHRTALKQYQTLIKELDFNAPVGGVPDDPQGGVAKALTFVSQFIPVGFGQKFVEKQIARVGAAAAEGSYRSAVLNLLDEAQVDPKLASTLLAAYRGSQAAKTQVARLVENEAGALRRLGAYATMFAARKGGSEFGTSFDRVQASPEQAPPSDGWEEIP